jgi:hypothetical protein
MTMLSSAFEKAMTSVNTWNGATSLSTPDVSGKTDGRLSLFFKTTRGILDLNLYQYLKKSSNEDLIDTFILSFQTRDPRGGKGERTIGRKMFQWLFENYPEKFRKVYQLIPEYGRWDDLITLFENKSNEKIQKDILKFFAFQLRKDRENMLKGSPISICAKWSPSEGDSDDKKYKIVDKLCEELNISKKEYRKDYLSPLRAYLKIVETFMCSNKWDEIEYSKVPSCAMKKLKKAFEKHSPELFTTWKNSLSKGEVKVNAKVLHPHELVREIRIKGYADEVTEGQWKVLEKEVEKLGVLEDSVVVVDTSGSMESPNYLPLDIAVAMGLIISKFVKGPFQHNVITFNTNPEFIKINDGTLYERFAQIRNIPWGGNTNLHATFELILNRAKHYELTDRDLPKRLFIISDMQFNSINQCGHLTNFQAIDKMYKDCGYTRPQIVFWNVNGESTDFPVSIGDNNTCLVSGASPVILDAIIKTKNFNSYDVLRTALDSERYKQIREIL